MPVHLTAPGVYIEEISSGVHTITGVATSIAAFVGYTKRGPDHRAKRIFSFADFDRAFGGLAADSELSYAAQHFFQNGGTEAYIVRVPKNGAVSAVLKLRDKVKTGADVLQLSALSTGIWSDDLTADVDYDGIADADGKSFNLTITDTARGVTERFVSVTMDKTKSTFVESVVNDDDNGSKMVSAKAIGTNPNRPAQSGTVSEPIALDATGKPKDIKNTKALTIRISSDLPVDPPVKNVTVAVLSAQDPVPTSALGVCRLLERAVNAAVTLPGATVRCAPVTSLEGTTRIRVVATIPGALDAQITFAAGTPIDATHDDADKGLKLSGGVANVSHYWFGTSRALPAFAEGVRTPASDGAALPTTGDLIAGLSALDKADLFNILCIPDATRAQAADPNALDAGIDPNAIFGAAATYCATRRAFLVIDPPPSVKDTDTAADWKDSGLTVREKNAAAYFPRLKLPDPLNEFKLRSYAPCGVVAGLFARIDSTRGVWKAPAGVEASLAGVQGLVYKLSDGEQGALNPLGLNCFRIFPIYGPVCWGARTLLGSDAEASEWKYVPVRRFALFLEESLFRGTKWVVFEPNDEPLWAQIRLNIGAFMHTLFRQGAFQGKTPREAYFVKCDSETTTQDDINRGVVNILVGFAPLKPAEFVVIQIQQMAGEIQV
jgi:phage tail sheath protein FI